MLALIVASYSTMELKSMYPRASAEREAMAFWHYSLGLTVLGLVWVQVSARLIGAAPVIIPAMPRIQAVLAKLVQFLLYALMIGLPLLGWLALSARGKPVPFYGLELPALIEQSKDHSRLFKNIHESLTTAGYFLIGIHASAALFHHYVKRDNTLKLMSPCRQV
jgi:cytochrome b561